MLLKILGHERGWAAAGDEFNGSMGRPRQMFITQSMVLAEKVREAYIKLLASYQSQQQALSYTPTGPASGSGLYDADEEAYRSGKHPEKYSDLGDNHFPFFGTVDQVTYFCYSVCKPNSRPPFSFTVCLKLIMA